MTNLELAQYVFPRIFKDPPTIKEEDGEIVIGDMTITPTKIRRKSIGKWIFVDGFTVTLAVVRSNYPHSPDDVDIVYLGKAVFFGEALGLVVKQYSVTMLDAVNPMF